MVKLSKANLGFNLCLLPKDTSTRWLQGCGNKHYILSQKINYDVYLLAFGKSTGFFCLWDNFHKSIECPNFLGNGSKRIFLGKSPVVSLISIYWAPVKMGNQFSLITVCGSISAYHKSNSSGSFCCLFSTHILLSHTLARRLWLEPFLDFSMQLSKQSQVSTVEK